MVVVRPPVCIQCLITDNVKKVTKRWTITYYTYFFLSLFRLRLKLLAGVERYYFGMLIAKNKEKKH